MKGRQYCSIYRQRNQVLRHNQSLAQQSLFRSIFKSYSVQFQYPSRKLNFRKIILCPFLQEMTKFIGMRNKIYLSTSSVPSTVLHFCTCSLFHNNTKQQRQTGREAVKYHGADSQQIRNLILSLFLHCITLTQLVGSLDQGAFSLLVFAQFPCFLNEEVKCLITNSFCSSVKKFNSSKQKSSLRKLGPLVIELQLDILPQHLPSAFSLYPSCSLSCGLCHSQMHDFPLSRWTLRPVCVPSSPLDSDPCLVLSTPASSITFKTGHFSPLALQSLLQWSLTYGNARSILLVSMPHPRPLESIVCREPEGPSEMHIS